MNPETSPDAATVAHPGAIWSGPFWALGAVVFLSYVNQTALLPVIPIVVRNMGGSESMAGVALGAFSIASFAFRPYLGTLVDRRGAGGVLLAGCWLLAALTTSLAVPLLLALVASNLLRGVGWAAINTSTNTLLAELAPPTRRGEAAGYYALFQAAAALVGPAAAVYWLSQGGSFLAVVLTCAVCVAVAGVIANQRLRSGSDVARGKGMRTGWELIDRTALLPSGLLCLAMFSQPAVLGFVPLYVSTLQLPAGVAAAFFVASGIGAILGRAVLGRASDRFTRGAALLAGFTLITISMGALSLARSGVVLLTVGVLYSVGLGMTLPALTALAIDRADSDRMGVAMATYSAAFQVGAGAGALASGVLIEAIGYRGLYVIVGLVAVAGVVSTAWRWSELGAGTRRERS